MGELGIGDDDTVIAYDDAGGVIAARLVWMLRVTGHDAALLDGGLAAWENAAGIAAAGAGASGVLATGLGSRSLDLGETSREAVAFTARPWPADLIASIDETESVAANGGTVIDARPAERFAGALDNLDPRAGHIPGSRSVPCRENLDPDGRLLSAADLRACFAVEDAGEVISSCGSGVTACHNLLAMEQAGLGRGRLFPGSWSQWSRDPARPVQIGAD
jgi:thiosulfate/3-mercaptopyruvate sulfurtransferase